jgi:hypothetical protein
VLRFEEAMERYRQRRLTAEEAGELLGMSGRHFRRMLVRYEDDIAPPPHRVQPLGTRPAPFDRGRTGAQRVGKPCPLALCCMRVPST